MAAKRFLDDSNEENGQPNEKRVRTRTTFASVIGEAIMVNSLKNLCVALEPLLRKVVHEEVENTLNRCTRPMITKSPSLKLQALEPSTLKLSFSNKLSLPIFTSSKILDADGSSLQIFLVDTRGDRMIQTYDLPTSIKVEILVLDGDFPPNDRKTWTAEEFDNNVVKERTGKRPLLAGDLLTVTLRDGSATLGDLEFTDNSSWIRSRKFRIGARVTTTTSRQGVRVHEAITEAFIVKDHRGELYKKHYPPRLGDEVWRLEKIGKDGAFHKKLTSSNVNTVQDFLKMSTLDQQKLRRILGPGMSDKMWDVTIKHARTCEMGNKQYVFRGSNCAITLNPICQIVDATIDGTPYSTQELSTLNRSYIENLARQAYADWDSLEEIVIGVSSDTSLLTQGELVDQYSSQHLQAVVKPPHQNGITADHMYTEVETLPEFASSSWQMTAAYHQPQIESGIQYRFSEAYSDGQFSSPCSLTSPGTEKDMSSLEM